MRTGKNRFVPILNKIGTNRYQTTAVRPLIFVVGGSLTADRLKADTCMNGFLDTGMRSRKA